MRIIIAMLYAGTLSGRSVLVTLRRVMLLKTPQLLLRHHTCCLTSELAWRAFNAETIHVHDERPAQSRAG
jgi:hypothetical protein